MHIMEKLLFIDDDTEILSLNQTYFTAHGYSADTACSAEEAVILLNKTDFDCIILDVRMEGQNGFELCRYIRDKSSAPVIFLTVLNDEDSLEKGFYSGGDDYLTKPYRIRELELRIRARIRHGISRGQEDKGSGLVLCPDEKQAYISAESLGLTVNEFLILQFLSQHKGTAFRQEEIYEALWGESYNTHSVQVLIMRIRKKIKELSPNKEYIRTQWGKGYVFTE